MCIPHMSFLEVLEFLPCMRSPHAWGWGMTTKRTFWSHITDGSVSEEERGGDRGRQGVFLLLLPGTNRPQQSDRSCSCWVAHILHFSATGPARAPPDPPSLFPLAPRSALRESGTPPWRAVPGEAGPALLDPDGSDRAQRRGCRRRPRRHAQ